MISNFIKLTLVALILCVGISPRSAYGQKPSISRTSSVPSVSAKQAAQYLELSKDLIEYTLNEAKSIYEYLPTDISQDQKEKVFEVRQVILDQIESNKIKDPSVEKNFNFDFEGKVSDVVKFEGGQAQVSWIEHKPVIHVTFEKYRGGVLIKPEGLDLEHVAMKRLINKIHILGDNSGYGITDIYNPEAITSGVTSEDNLLQKINKRIKSFYKKTVVKTKRALKKNLVTSRKDLTILELDFDGSIKRALLSKSRKWGSFDYWKGFKDAVWRKPTMKKFLKALAISALPTAASFGLETYLAGQASYTMAGLNFVFYVVTQTFYASYMDFKLTQSNTLQFVKLLSVALVMSNSYAIIEHGWELGKIGAASLNALMAVGVFHHWRLNKVLAYETRKNTGSYKLGKFEIMQAQIEDLVLDSTVNSVRQWQLITSGSIWTLVATAYAGDLFALVRYHAQNMKELKNARVQTYLDEVFHSGFFKRMANKIKKLPNPCNFLLKPRT